MSLTISERITRLETKVEQVEKTLGDIDEKLDVIHEAFLKGKGAKWVLVGLLSIVASLAASFPSIISYLSGLPR